MKHPNYRARPDADLENFRLVKRIEQQFDHLVDRPTSFSVVKFPTGCFPAILHNSHAGDVSFRGCPGEWTPNFGKYLTIFPVSQVVLWLRSSAYFRDLSRAARRNWNPDISPLWAYFANLEFEVLCDCCDADQLLLFRPYYVATTYVHTVRINRGDTLEFYKMFENMSIQSSDPSQAIKPLSFVEDALFLGRALPVLAHLAKDGICESNRKSVVQFAEDELTKGTRLVYYNALHTSIPTVRSTPIWTLFAL